MDVYFISGLGADRRAFERIRLPEGFVPHYLDWIPPHPRETLDAYALRLAEGIDRAKPFAVVGLSMGGMIASVLAQKLRPQKTVLISSVASAREFPPLFKISRRLRLHRLAPVWLLRKPNTVVHRLFGARSSGEKALMDYLVANADPRFVKWAMDAIVNWSQTVRPPNVFHLHGSADKILPLQYTRPDCVIEKGSHFMVWTRAGEVSKKLAEVLAGKD